VPGGWSQEGLLSRKTATLKLGECLFSFEAGQCDILTRIYPLRMKECNVILCLCTQRAIVILQEKEGGEVN
jgi:hypothetical protein